MKFNKNIFQALKESNKDISRIVIRGKDETYSGSEIEYVVIDNTLMVRSAEIIEFSSCDFRRLFADMHKLQKIDIRGVDVTRVQDTHGMFAGCDNLLTIDLSHLDLNSIMDTRDMFKLCSKLTYVTLKTRSTAIYPDTFYGCNSLKSVVIK